MLDTDKEMTDTSTISLKCEADVLLDAVVQALLRQDGEIEIEKRGDRDCFDLGFPYPSRN